MVESRDMGTLTKLGHLKHLLQTKFLNFPELGFLVPKMGILMVLPHGGYSEFK